MTIQLCHDVKAFINEMECHERQNDLKIYLLDSLDINALTRDLISVHPERMATFGILYGASTDAGISSFIKADLQHYLNYAKFPQPRAELKPCFRQKITAAPTQNMFPLL